MNLIGSFLSVATTKSRHDWLWRFPSWNTANGLKFCMHAKASKSPFFGVDFRIFRYVWNYQRGHGSYFFGLHVAENNWGVGLCSFSRRFWTFGSILIGSCFEVSMIQQNVEKVALTVKIYRGSKSAVLSSGQKMALRALFVEIE